MVAFNKLFLFAVGVSAVTVQNVLSDLQTVDSDVRTLNSQLSTFDGSFGQVGTIQQTVNKLLTDIRKTNSDAAVATPPAAPGRVSVADSNSIINYIVGTLEPDINTAVNTLNSKRSLVTDSAVLRIIQNDLVWLRGNTTTLGGTLISRSDTSRTSAASSIFAKVTNDIARAQATYGTP